MNVKIVNYGTGIMVHEGQFGRYKQTSDGEIHFHPKGTAVQLERMYQDIDDGSFHLAISFLDAAKRKSKLLLSRAELLERSVASLVSSKGLCIDERSVDAFQIHVNQLCRDYQGEISLVHRHLGWSLVSANGSDFFPVFHHYYSGSGVPSEYIGRHAVKPKGSWEEWKRMVEQDVLPYEGLATSLLIGLSAVLHGLVYEDVLLGNPIFSLSGDSSSGKSTAGMLAASVAFAPILGTCKFVNSFGDVVEGIGGVLSWAATANGLIGQLAGINGVPVVLDEISRAGNINFESIVYALHDGVDKVRLTKSAEVKKTKSFHAPILAIGEVRLSDRCNNAPDGARTRIFEFGGKRTVDADHARRIKTVCLQNYAHAAPRFAGFLLQGITKAEVLSIFEQKWREFSMLIPKTKFSDRRSQQFAGLLLTTAELAKRGLDLQFDVEAIKKYLVSCEIANADENEDISARAYRDVLNWVNSSPSNFSTDSAHYAKKFGKIFVGRDIPQYSKAPPNLVREIAIRIPELESFLRRNNFLNIRLILSTWRDQGLLNCESGKLYRKRTIGTVQEHLYVLREFLDEPSDDDIATAEETKRAVNLSRRISEQVFADWEMGERGDDDENV